jgi:hypothetical protein
MKCKDCGQEFASEAELAIHQLHDGGQFECLESQLANARKLLGLITGAFRRFPKLSILMREAEAEAAKGGKP